VKWKALRLRGAGMMLDRGLLALDARTSGALFIQTHADTFAAKSFLAELAFDLDLAQPFSFDIGQFQIFEHQIDQLIEADVGFVVVDAGTVAGLMTCFAVLALTDDVAGLGLAVADLTDAGDVLAVDEAVFFDAADGDLNNSVLVFTDDGFFGDDVRDVIADRFANLLPVPQAITSAAIAALAG